MKLALIGANGNVGSELWFLLQNDVELKPITRNRLGSVFLNHHGFALHVFVLLKFESPYVMLVRKQIKYLVP